MAQLPINNKPAPLASDEYIRDIACFTCGRRRFFKHNDFCVYCASKQSGKRLFSVNSNPQSNTLAKARQEFEYRRDLKAIDDQLFSWD